MARLLVACLYVWAAAVTLTQAKPPKRKAAQSRPDKDAREEPERISRSLLPELSSQCLVNGISLFEGAVWSPEPCNVCQCLAGAVSCRAIPCTREAQSGPQTVVQRPRKLNPRSENIVEAAPKRKDKDSGKGKDKVKEKEKEKLPQHSTPKSKRPSGKKMAETLPRKVVTLVPPIRVVEKPVVHQRRKPEAILPVTGGGQSLTWAPDGLDDDDDDDDDDNDSSIMRLSTGRVLTPPLEPRPAGQPAASATVPITRRPPVGPPTSRRPPAPPAPVSPLLPGGRPVVRFGERPGFPVQTPQQRNNYMESLPAGCLLSDSLIACGSTGIGHLPVITDTGVRTLYLADNKISKIPARALAGLPNLEWLDLSKNKLDDFSFSPTLFKNLTRLRRLNLDGNNLTKIPALPPSLMELKINDNRLSGLTPNSFKGLFKLLTLELEDNRFHDGNVSPLTFRPLRRLTYLRLDDNKFRAIPSGLPTSLQELHLMDNRIEVVHAGVLNKTINLRVLNLSHNKIREDRIAPRAWIHLSKLDSLDLSHNKLVHVPSFLPIGLRQLLLHHNHIERIPGYVFAHMQPGLDALHLSYNRLREDGVDEVSFLGLYTSLTELLLDHNRLGAVPRGILQLKALQNLRLNNNFISYIPLNAICDTRASEDSPLLSVHLESNLIDRRLIPPTAFSCIKNYHSVVLRPQNYEDIYE